MRSSHASVRHMPPPNAGPFTAAITGWGRWRISGTSREYTRIERCAI